MPKMTAAEATKAKVDLKKAGCPDDCCDKLISAGTPWAVIQAILAFVASHPGLVTDIWALIQAILTGGGLPPVPTP